MLAKNKKKFQDISKKDYGFSCAGFLKMWSRDQVGTDFIFPSVYIFGNAPGSNRSRGPNST